MSQDIGQLEQAVQVALMNYARAVHGISGSEMLTHFAVVIATYDMDADAPDVHVVTSEGHRGGMVPWQSRGLLAEGLEYL